MQRVQRLELSHQRECDGRHTEAGVEEVLQAGTQADGPQDKTQVKRPCRIRIGFLLKERSSIWQSSGFQNRRLGVRVPSLLLPYAGTDSKSTGNSLREVKDLL